ncbi:hypothetical protein LTR37_011716 [Vermiconidia calcicola]|uniref:Uncharacterized protein n=1 Tax=Vermiconidia calcicola TaxID=1690605 RepID=A0ACC3N1A3_9PEZI|nr:hypothetical protein LTR37_011716 [Vermiconidia calcicola]
MATYSGNDHQVSRVNSNYDEDPEKPVFRDGDKALEFLRTEADVGEGENIDEKRLVRKIDRQIVPLMFCCYFLQYLDKSLLNYASVMGIIEDTNLSTEEYGTLSLIFYVAFLAFEFPHAYLMQRLPTAKYLGSMVVCWGTVVACTSACNSYGSLVATRFLLGMFESAISPSLIIVTSMWYQRDEQPRRIGFWYIGVGCASMVGALMSYGFQFYVGHAFASWQIMFLVVGCITVFVGGIVIWLMPDNPMSARRLTHAERVAAVERLRENQTGVENKHFKLYQVGQAFRDPQTWLLIFIVTAASIPNGAVGSFQSLIISGLGFTDKEVALLQIPGGVIAVISVLTATYTASKFNARAINIIIWSAIGGLLGGSLLAFLPESNQAGRMAGNYITHVVGAFLPCSYSFAAANTAGHTKKVTMNAVLLMAFCLGNILGPLTFRDEDAPNYTPAKITIVAVDSFAIGTTVVLLMYYRWQNKKRDGMMAHIEHKRDQEFADLTDIENKEFRYKY